MHTMFRQTREWPGHMLSRNYLLQLSVEGKMLEWRAVGWNRTGRHDQRHCG